MSIKQNYFFVLLGNVSQIFIPLVTFPYVSRVLGPSGLGAYNSANAFVTYLVMLSAMGVSIYGQRLVAKQKSDPQKLASEVNHLVFVNVLSVCFWVVAYLLMLFFVPKMRQEWALYAVAGWMLVLSPWSLDWYFRGLEDFKYITTRTVVVRLILTALIFLFVRKEGDELVYMALTVAATCVPYVLNVRRLLERVKLSPRKLVGANLGVHFKSMIPTSLYGILTTAYSTFPLLYVGFCLGNQSAGVFSAAQRMTTIFLMLFTTFGNVVFPRMSALGSDQAKMKELILRSFMVIIPLAIFVASSIYFYSPSLVTVLAGKKYTQSIPLLQLLAPMIFMIALAQIFVSQILFPLGKEREVLRRSFVAAMVGVLGTLALEKWFGLLGVAGSVLLAETVMTLLLGVLCYRIHFVPLKLVGGVILGNLMTVVPLSMGLKLLSERLCAQSSAMGQWAAMGVGGGVFLLLQIYVLKNEVFQTELAKVKRLILSKLQLAG